MSTLSCPVCSAAMQENSKNGVTIDVCPQCRGVWLDRGELEKLLGAVQVQQNRMVPRYDDDDDRHEHHRKEYGHHGYHGHKRKSKMESIFDIFD